MTIEVKDTLPSDASPYVLRDREGSRYLFGRQLATIIASGDSSGDLFELVAISGGQGDSFPAHKHASSHEGIYVLDGLVEVQLNDDVYILSVGDYAHIPAGTVHSYQMSSHNTRFLSVTSKGAIAKLYSQIGSPTDLYVHPPHADSIDLAALISEKANDVDFELVSDSVASGEPALVTNTEVPDSVKPYVIAAGGGIHRVVGRELYVFLATQANTNGDFIVLYNEGPKGHAIVQHFHEKHTETFLCTAGQMTMWANGEEYQLHRGDFLHVPANTTHSFRLDSHYTHFFSVLATGLFEPFFHTLGTPYEGNIFPAEPGPARFDRLMQAVQAGELDLVMAGPPPDGSPGPGAPPQNDSH